MIQRVYADGSWWIVRCECMIHQRVNYLLDRSHFRGYSQSAQTNKRTNKQEHKKMNKQTMSEADNYNKYNYDKELGKKHMWQRQYIISGSEVWAWGLDQKFRLSQRSDIGRLM